MSYLFQTFSVGQVLTAAQMNQVEVNIRDHQHGVAGVSSSGMTFVSPVFTTQISTPKIVTASGALDIIPANSVLNIGDPGGSNTVNVGGGAGSCTLKLDGGGGTSTGSYLSLLAGSTVFANIGNEAVIIGSGASKELCYLSETGLGQKWMVNGSATVAMALTSAGVFSVGSTSQFAVSAAGVVTAATVPLARMMRTEVQGSGAPTYELTVGTVVAGDRILVTAINSSTGTSLTLTCYSGAGATVDFAGTDILGGGVGGNTYNKISISGVARVLTGGNLILNFQANGTGTMTIYAHAMVLNNG